MDKSQYIADIHHTRFKVVNKITLGRRDKKLLRLWTFQPIKVWHKLQAKGHLFVNPDFIDVDFISCHKWMQKQMAHRLSDYQGHSPWWAYYGEKPDLRSWRFYFPTGHGVCLELQLPKERVLLSDYETWHCVMARQYVPFDSIEEKEWSHDVLDKGFGGWPAPKTWRRRIVSSWKRIFDIEGLRFGGLWPVSHIQGCFERLDMTDVVTVAELTAR